MCDVIGDLKKIRIGHDDSGIANNWFLGKVRWVFDMRLGFS